MLSSKFPFHKSAAAGILLFGLQVLAAQTSIVVNGSAATTAIVGITGSQTARLNVLNLQPVIPGVAAVVCPATLEIYDDTGALLKQLTVINISPATAAALVFKPSVPSTAPNARIQIRAVVFKPSTSPADTGSAPVSTGCSVMPSLEIIDDPTGDTRSFTTDFRVMLGYRLVPSQATGR